MYRLVISEKSKDPYGHALEILGSYNPYTKELACKQDRIEHWLKNGAGMSATVNNLLIAKEIIKGEKVRSYKPKKQEKPEGEAAAKPAGEAKPEEKPAPAVAETKEPAKEEKPAETAAPAKEEPKAEKPAEAK